MGFISALKTIGKDIASGVDDAVIGYSRLKDAAKKTFGSVDRSLEGKTLMRFGNETEARWVSPFRPASKKVYAGINYESTENLSNAITNIAEDEAALFDKSILAKQRADRLSFIEDTAKQGSHVENTVAAGQLADAEDYSSLLGDTTGSTSTVNAKEISEAAMRDTGYGLSAEDKALKRNRPNYANELREQGAKERAAAKTALGSDVTVNATGTTQPDVIAAANNNMGASAQAASEVNRNANIATQQGIQAAPSTAGQAEAAVQKQQALDNLPDTTVTRNSGLKDVALGASAIVGGGVFLNAWRNPSNKALYRAGTERIMLPNNIWNSIHY